MTSFYKYKAVIYDTSIQNEKLVVGIISAEDYANSTTAITGYYGEENVVKIVELALIAGDNIFEFAERKIQEYTQDEAEVFNIQEDAIDYSSNKWIGQLKYFIFIK